MSTYRNITPSFDIAMLLIAQVCPLNCVASQYLGRVGCVMDCMKDSMFSDITDILGI
jgi:hypothetical protein